MCCSTCDLGALSFMDKLPRGNEHRHLELESEIDSIVELVEDDFVQIQGSGTFTHESRTPSQFFMTALSSKKSSFHGAASSAARSYMYCTIVCLTNKT